MAGAADGGPSGGIPGAIEALAAGLGVECRAASPFNLFAYGYGGQDDHGWGCAYRCLQMLADHAARHEGTAAAPASIRELQEHLEAKLAAFASLLWEHFGSAKSPVMIDDSIKAYVIGASRLKDVAAGPLPDNIQVLLFDPHVAALPTEEKPLGAAGSAVQWREFRDVFVKEAKRALWMHARVLCKGE
ncbi:hypothetical protein FNF29_00243 [Cafeteria roenbergensis]|uniref:UFSP1/2/DUB catalytic domain-containing protein n=1 Tax=Cafeteria roenbergensis TaxID=33653 RepID=A0A5A8CY10_CAFRO|nr:hypothetical protein FNF29_00243 [Cafeteria roenbergensis]|eukprot:KAA0157668.1 hypothetical protein FNF29_00243 [Cafeteria roenbergensis]